MNTTTINQPNALSYSEIKKINLGLYSFFEYIRMPPICTSAIIVKNYLKYIIINNINKVNFKSLKASVELLKLDWKTELSMLRNYLKDWHKNYCEKFKNKYVNIKYNSEKLNILHLLQSFKCAYYSPILENGSTFNPYNFSITLEENKLFDRKLVRNYSFEQYCLFENNISNFWYNYIKIG